MVITNFEAVNFLVKNQQLLTTFDNLVIDEFTAFKNKDAKRSKNAQNSYSTSEGGYVCLVLLIPTLFLIFGIQSI